jgi:hypothetical protein
VTRDEVLARLNDLPGTYRRVDPTYVQLVGSIATSLSRHTHAADALLAQTAFTSAEGKWLDVWGLAFGIVRHDGEADAAYRTRIAGTLVAGSGPPVAIETYMSIARGLAATVVENFPAVGWSLQMAGGIAAADEAALALDLARVRPAGVPYTFQFLRGGLYLSTINYVGRASVTGAYLVNPLSTVPPPIGPNTNSTAPLLPTTFLTDPNLNSF